MKKQERISPAEHLQAAMAARDQRQIERRLHLARSREWADERRKHRVPHDHPAYEYVKKRLEADRDNDYKLDEPWCYEGRVKIHLTRWHELTQRGRDNVVYYIKVSKYIKVGTTVDVDRRLRDYPPDSELLATEPGGYDIEAFRHNQFAEYLSARKEWFEPGPKLMQHIEILQRKTVEEFREAQQRAVSA